MPACPSLVTALPDTGIGVATGQSVPSSWPVSAISAVGPAGLDLSRLERLS
jgi:hypothetical protein